MQIDSRLSIGASSDAPYVGSHEFFGETARRQAAPGGIGWEQGCEDTGSTLHSPMPPRVTRGYLRHYAEQVAPEADGAVLPR